jgi:hypothetical protein
MICGFIAIDAAGAPNSDAYSRSPEARLRRSLRQGS